MEGRYWIALFKEGGESAGVERELARHSRLDESMVKIQAKRRHVSEPHRDAV